MLKEHNTFFRRSLFIGDFLLLTLSFVFVSKGYLPNALQGLMGEMYQGSTGSLQAILIGAVFLCLFFLVRYQGYGHFRGAPLFDLILPIAKALAVSTLILGFWLVFVELDRLSRMTILSTFSSINFLLLGGSRIAVWGFLLFIRQRGLNYRNVLVVGTGARAQEFAQSVQDHASWGLRIMGFVDWERERVNVPSQGYPVRGHLSELPSILNRHPVDEVVFLVPRTGLDLMDQPIRACEERGINVRICADLFSLPLAKPQLVTFAGMPMITYSTTLFPQSQLNLKRGLDILISAMGLLCCLPFFVGIGLAVKTTPGSVLFRQERVGLNGRRFTLYKFRSMVANAQDQLEDVKACNEMGGPMFKSKRDPRITWVGKFLRRWSLDELPQLINVLRGEMSLVGPRPSLPDEVQQFTAWQKRRLSVRPGVTGLWQVSGRNTIDFERWMKMDLEYIDSWSLGLDWKILRKTIPVMLSGKGAH